ncbi:hypothetical protein [Nocardia brasiliensis]
MGLLAAGAWVFGFRYHMEWRDRALWLGAIILIGVVWAAVRIKPPTVPERKANTLSTAFKETSIARALIEDAAIISRQYSRPVLALLADMVVEPATYRDRVTENLDLGRWVTERSVSMDVLIGDKQFDQICREKHILVPLIEPPKGWLFDRLSIRSQYDEDVVSLAYGGQSAALYVAVLIHQFHAAFPYLPAEIDNWPRKDMDALRDLVMIVSKSAWALKSMSREIDMESADESTLHSSHRARRYDVIIQEHQAELDAVLGITDDHEKQLMEAQRSKDYLRVEKLTELDKLRRIARIGIGHYIVIVRCRPAKYLKLAYTYEQSTGTLKRKATPEESSILSRVLQGALGIPSGYLEVGLTRASHAKSYHMHVSAPEGSYVRLSYVSDDEGRAVLINARPSIAVNIPYLRPVGKSVTSAHVYGRNLNSIFAQPDGKIVPVVPKLDVAPASADLRPVRLGLRARICERPTGTELFATLVAWSVLLVTIILREASKAEVHTDVAVAVLALPAAIAALAVFFVRAFERSLLVSTAGAALTATTTLLAVVVTFIFGIQATTSNAGDHGSDGWSRWSMPWQVLLTLAVVLTISATGMIAIRTRRYFVTRFKSDP